MTRFQEERLRRQYPPIDETMLEPDTALCPTCGGERLIDVGYQNNPTTVLIVCDYCDGVGFVTMESDEP